MEVSHPVRSSHVGHVRVGLKSRYPNKESRSEDKGHRHLDFRQDAEFGQIHYFPHIRLKIFPFRTYFVMSDIIIVQRAKAETFQSTFLVSEAFDELLLMCNPAFAISFVSTLEPWFTDLAGSAYGCDRLKCSVNSSREWQRSTNSGMVFQFPWPSSYVFCSSKNRILNVANEGRGTARCGPLVPRLSHRKCEMDVPTDSLRQMSPSKRADSSPLPFGLH